MPGVRRILRQRILMNDDLLIPEHLIRSKAYDLWEARGRLDGDDQMDWYTAETILRLEAIFCHVVFLPYFSYVQVSQIQSDLSVINYVKEAFFSDSSNSWIEIFLDIETVFECDRNRRLHFDEGFLRACYRVFTDTRVSSIADADHFPYRDLPKFRAKVECLTELHDHGDELPPPLFFYPAPYQLEILDGVHRCLAAFEVVQRRKATDCHFVPQRFRVWLGFNRLWTEPAMIVHQLWAKSLFYVESRHLHILYEAGADTLVLFPFNLLT